MNTEHIDSLIMEIKEVTKNPKKRFAMNTWLRDDLPLAEGECGTAGCIAGWALVAMGDVNKHRSEYGSGILFTTQTQHEVAKWLGITWGQSQQLFSPPIDDAYNATAEQAIKVLELMRDKGVIDWERILVET